MFFPSLIIFARPRRFTVHRQRRSSVRTQSLQFGCVSWAKNGFCGNIGYTMDMRKQYCGVKCGYCNTDGTQTAAGGGSTYTACSDKNANCASWNANGFCANQTISNSMKLLYCCGTCRPSLQSGSTTTITGTTTVTATTTATTTTATTTTTAA
ncbi:hypothetical protein PRIPAC_97284 [Pristionchus pacificus]|uniref:ShK domain-containing protein n=1 Tax=Pristionchus pacificus TaxID=54126 RepID=A0A2A6D1L8_PRIPA|nr:hypothetical protein PRIPAC_97284 [Pristionchus pacificus]|eukprot:PDM84280.1 ShK domain-containing protein [Pristionchus pacificus]